MVRRALVEGRAAFARGDWDDARLNLGRYLSVHQDDPEVLGLYARAQLAARPLRQENISQAMGAYRRLLVQRPTDLQAFRRLALLYEATGALGELAHIADRRLEVLPGDPPATVARAKELLFREKRSEARAVLEALAGTAAGQPDFCRDLVEACALLSSLSEGPTAGGADAGLTWLDLAVQSCPQSAQALVQRAARRQVLAATQPAGNEHDAAARTDLEKAEALGEIEPPTRLLLSEVWMSLREYERAARQLELADSADWATLENYFVDPADWTAALFVQQAKLALLTGRITDGVALAEKVLNTLEEQPQRVAAIPLAIELLVADGRAAEAHHWLDDYVEQLKLRQRLGVGDEQLAWLRAIIARAENQPYEVIAQLAPLAELTPARPGVQLLLAEAYLLTDQPGRAARLLERVPPQALTDPTLALTVARARLARGAWQAALQALQAAGNADDTDNQVLRLAAQLGSAYEQRATPETIDQLATQLRAIQAAHPDNLTVRLLLASVVERREGLAAAIEVLQRALAECDQPLAAYRALARLYANNGQMEQARATLEQCCERYGERADPWLDLSALLVDEHRLDEAQAVLRGAGTQVRADQRSEVLRRLGLVQLLAGQREAGIATLTQLATEEPRDCRTRALLLELPEIVKDQETATRLIEEIKRVEGSTGVTWRRHEARLWLERPDWYQRRTDIEAHLKYCRDADPEETAVALLLGELYERLADWASAETTYRAAFKASQSLEVADRLLNLYRRQQRFAEGRELLTRLTQTLNEAALQARSLMLDIDERRYENALRELQLRVAGAEREPADFVRLAWVSYTLDRNARRALDYLDQAERAGAPSVDVARARVMILDDQRRPTEAARVLDELVTRERTSDALLLRASYRYRLGQMDLAEQDYAALAQTSASDYGVAVLGEFYAQSGRLDQAIDVWETGLKTFPDSLMLQRGLAKAYLTRGGPGDRERAEKLAAQLERVNPDDADLLWIRAVAAVQVGTPDGRAEARRLLAQAVNAAPTRAEVYAGLCDLAFRIGDNGLARDLARRGSQANPDDVNLRVLSARAEVLLGNLEAARGLAAAVLATDAQNLAAVEVAVQVAAQQGDAAALRRELDRLERHVADNPDSDLARLLRARALAALGDLDTARQELGAFCRTEAGARSMPALIMLQDLHRLAGDFEAAATTLDLAAAQEPEHPAVLRGRVLLLAEQRRYEELAALLRDAHLNHSQVDVLLSAASALASVPKHVEDAVALARRACELAPDSAAALLAVGDLEFQRGDTPAASNAYRALLKLQPDQPIALNNLAWVLAVSGTDLDEALTTARRAVALQPNDANFRDTLAFVLKRLGRLEEAKAEYRRSIDLTAPASPERARLLLHLARVCAELDDWSLVAGSLSEALAAAGAETFEAEERAEIDRLLATARQPRQ